MVRGDRGDGRESDAQREVGQTATFSLADAPNLLPSPRFVHSPLVELLPSKTSFAVLTGIVCLCRDTKHSNLAIPVKMDQGAKPPDVDRPPFQRARPRKVIIGSLHAAYVGVQVILRSTSSYS